MPLYTYIMSHRGETKVSQHKFSNFTGFILTPVSVAFPNLKSAFGEIMRMKPEPVPNAKRTWSCSILIAGEPFAVHVVETRD